MQEARALLRFELSAKLQALPLSISNSEQSPCLIVAVANASNHDLERALRFAVGMEVQLIEVQSDILDDSIFKAYHGDSGKLATTIETLKAGAQNIEPRRIAPPSFRGSEAEISRFLEALVDYGLAHNASDIHIEPRPEGSRAKLRVNGELLTHENCIANLAQHEQLVARIKILAHLDTTERRRPQDGSFCIPLVGKQARARVSILPTVHGEKVVLRLIATNTLATLESLGLSESALGCLQSYLDRSEGLILLSGSTGSGKTTTLYAALAHLSKQNLNIVAVEDPVEYYVSGVTQTSIDERIGLTYPTVLRAILRQDPDVVLVGEIRDNESAQISIQAAMTGHLMLSTVHARSAAEVVTRLRFLGVDSLSLVQALQLSLNQKLFPKLCQHCKVIDLSASRTYEADVYKAVGCPKCSHTGSSGQIPAFEILEVRGQVAEIIASQDPNLVAELAGLRSIRMEDEIKKLVLSGVIAPPN